MWPVGRGSLRGAMSLARPTAVASVSGVLHAPALLLELQPDGTQPGIRTPHLPDVSRLQDRSARRVRSTVLYRLYT